MPQDSRPTAESVIISSTNQIVMQCFWKSAPDPNTNASNIPAPISWSCATTRACATPTRTASRIHELHQFHAGHRDRQHRARHLECARAHDEPYRSDGDAGAFGDRRANRHRCGCEGCRYHFRPGDLLPATLSRYPGNVEPYLCGIGGLAGPRGSERALLRGEPQMVAAVPPDRDLRP